MRIAIDVGYSHVKAMTDLGGKKIFPSVIAPFKENPVIGMGKFGNKRHYVEVKKKKFFVGDAATRSLAGISTMNREKPPEMHDLFILTASYLCGVGAINLPQQNEATHLAVGLPFAYYKDQKDELKNRLLRLGETISVDGGKEKYISFNNVTVIPQGLGVLFSIETLPAYGYVGLIDIGSFTTEYMLFVIEDGELIPINDACGSVEAGTYLVQQDLASAFQSQTGAPLAHFIYADTLKSAMNNKPISFKGKEINLSGVYKQSCKEATQVILEAIRSAWVSRVEYLSLTAFAGGGTEMFKDYIKESFPNLEIAEDAVFANCLGNLKLIS